MIEYVEIQVIVIYIYMKSLNNLLNFFINMHNLLELMLKLHPH